MSFIPNFFINNTTFVEASTETKISTCDVSINTEITVKNNFKDLNFKEKIIFENTLTKLFLISYKEFTNKYIIENWEKNRPVDNIRVNEILEYYQNQKIDIAPGIIYCWANNNKLYIYDGLHRYTAVEKLNEITDYKKNLKILVQINYSLDECDIVKDFININKSIPIPQIYLENESLIKKQTCQNIADNLCRKFPNFISTSRKPHIYNFNRDLIVDFISTLNIDFKIKNADKKVFNLLIKINLEAKEDILKNNIIHPKKCDKYNFYLFYKEKYYIKTFIEDNFTKINNERYTEYNTYSEMP
jgi:hypothetical protein